MDTIQQEGPTHLSIRKQTKLYFKIGKTQRLIAWEPSMQATLWLAIIIKQHFSMITNYYQWEISNDYSEVLKWITDYTTQANTCHDCKAAKIEGVKENCYFC